MEMIIVCKFHDPRIIGSRDTEGGPRSPPPPPPVTDWPKKPSLNRVNRLTQNLNEKNKTFKFERHVSATPVPSSVYGWNYNDEQYIAENWKIKRNLPGSWSLIVILPNRGVRRGLREIARPASSAQYSKKPVGWSLPNDRVGRCAQFIACTATRVGT